MVDFDSLVRTKFERSLRTMEEREAENAALMETMVQAVLDMCASMLSSPAFCNVFGCLPYAVLSDSTPDHTNIGISGERDIQDHYLIVGLKAESNGIACTASLSSECQFDQTTVPASRDRAACILALEEIIAAYVVREMAFVDRQRMRLAAGPV
jgi:hypothetical protein